MMSDNQVFIIAEAGVNHNGSLDMALALVDAAAAAGVDAVKFQTFNTDLLVCRHAPKAQYQQAQTGNTEGQFEMLKRLELSAQDHSILLERCRFHNLHFLSTAFDEQSIALLSGLGLALWKIPSGEITNYSYLKNIGALRKKVILSTGMSYLGEIEDALRVLEEAGTRRTDITLLHCTTEYPAPYEEVNLKAMSTLSHAFGLPIGYSDHTAGIEIPLAAVALGATVIEKHFTLDRTLPGPDHRASIEPMQLSEMVRAIRNVEKALGHGVKQPSASELRNRAVARKSICAARTIEAGEMLTTENLIAKRPGTGLSPMLLAHLLGTRASRPFDAEQQITL